MRAGASGSNSRAVAPSLDPNGALAQSAFAALAGQAAALLPEQAHLLMQTQGWRLPSGAEEPKEKERMAAPRCTDIPMVFLLVVAFGGLAKILQYAQGHGDLRRLYHGFDFLGNLCGVGAYQNRPYLFYCMDTLDLVVGLDLTHPLCVEECPNSTASWHSCYAGHSTSMQITNPETNSFDETFHYSFQKVADYPTKVFLGGYCMPKENALYTQLKEALMRSYGGRFATTAKELAAAWQALLASALVAVVCGYMYLRLLRLLAGVLVYATLIIPCVAFLCTGSFIAASSQGWITAQTLQSLPCADKLDWTNLLRLTTGNKQWDLYIAVALVAVGALFGLVGCCCHRSIATAIGCIEAASDCLAQMPSLLVTPIFTVAVQLLALAVMFAGFLLLVSCGKVEQESLARYVTTPLGEDVAGIGRSLTFEEQEYYYLAFYIFMMIWVFELCTAITQFCIIYAVEVWYFVPYVGGHKRDLPLLPLMRGLRIGLCYHLGSLAFGSALVAFLRVIRMAGALITRHEKEQGNKVGQAAAACATAVVTCLERFIMFLNKNAYMDIAMQSSNYCEAAAAAFKTLNSNVVAIGLLNGVTWVLQMSGTGSMSVASGAITYAIVTQVPMFCNPAEPTFVTDPMPICIAAAILGAAVTWIFMMVFDTVADTIIYCFAVDDDAKTGRSSGKYVPEGLHALIEKHTPEKH